MSLRSSAVAAALAAALMGAAAAGPAAAGNLWYDFDHDASLATIQPRTASNTDSLSVVLDLTGVTAAPPFILTVPLGRNLVCEPNGGNCNGTNIDIGSVAAQVDSSWLVQTSQACEPLRLELGLRFVTTPGPGPKAVARLGLTYAPEGPYCINANRVCFDPAQVAGQPIGFSTCVTVHDANVPVIPITWGRLRRLFR